MEQVINLPRATRGGADDLALAIRASSFDEKANTVDVIWTTGATVRRFTWFDGAIDEQLIVDPKSVRLDRLNASAPFLDTHDQYSLSSVIGVVVEGSARIAKGVGTATIRLSRTEKDADVVAKIRDGLIRNVSVGYRIHKVEKIEGKEGDVPLWRVVDWEPMEISAVPIGADPKAQARSDAATEKFPTIVTSTGLDHAEAAAARMRMRHAQLTALRA